MAWHRGQAYGQDLRDRVLTAPGTMAAVAARFGVSPSYVCKARQRLQRLGERGPGQQRCHMPRTLGAAHEQALLAHLTQHNHATLTELCAWLQQTHGVRIGRTTMGKTLARLGWTLKKRAYVPRSNNAPM